MPPISLMISNKTNSIQPEKEGQKKKKDASSPAFDVGDVDPLLECLVFLSAHYGRAKSAEAITAGLAYDEEAMRPQLFCEAAERIGIKAQIV